MEEQIKSLFCSLGADICGIARANDFGSAPKGFQPVDLWAECKSVVVLAKALPKGAMKSTDIRLYNFSNEMTSPIVDRISFEGARMLEDTFGCIALPIPCDQAAAWDKDTQKAQGFISMRHAAELAGLGRIGRNSLVLNEKYGNRLVFGAVLTHLELTPDQPADSICLPNCDLCLKSCPTGALKGGHTDQACCRPHTYTGGHGARCNLCRGVCPVGLGQ